MLIRNSEHVYMIDRDNTVFAVRGLKFPSRKNLEESLRDTLVDGVRQQKYRKWGKIRWAKLSWIPPNVVFHWKTCGALRIQH